MRYTTYPFYTDRVLSIMSKRDRQGFPKPKNYKVSLNEIFARAEQEELESITDNMSIRLYSYESYWEKQGSHSVFIATKEVLSYLQQCKLNGDINIYPESEIHTAIVNMPVGTVIAGETISSVLFTFVDAHKFTKDHDLPFAASLGREADQATLNALDQHDQQTLLALTFKTLKSGDTIRYVFNAKELFAAFTTTSAESYLAVKIKGALANSHRELAIAIGKIVLSLIIHISVHPEDLRNGFPNNYSSPKVHKRSEIHVRLCKSFHFSPQINSEKSAHFRSGHFRQLRHERYYQGEHKDKPIGSRWVSVNPTSVNREFTPHTVEEI